MATRLLAWPDGLHAYDVAQGPLDELAAAGASVAGSVGELAGAVDLLCVMVRDDDQVRDVLDQALNTARPGLTVAIHSTVAPGTPARLADLAREHGVHVVDAPVSGGPMGAAEGTLAIMVGGTDEGFAACAAPFALLGTKVVHAGEAGAGTRMKLARNLLHFISFTAATEAQRLAESAGLDLKVLGEVVRHTDAITGGPGAIMHRDTAAPIDPDDFWFGVFSHVRALGEKDLAFAIELADQLDVDVPLARLASQRLGAGLGLPATTKEHA
ncbi:3-hydroxyisobutyrate dehydrogenase [Nocardioides daedukensis]|uniref:3-hydroxyisobutyrate dehydrogenase n=2 Tax=Nocardioides daedukensis TaxID=634462 RepID=A0A7Y9S1K9_9ACTN|nr:3-hydroxyisobutyrate dehydrogenase [Nocardioides daedukensis]